MATTSPGIAVERYAPTISTLQGEAWTFLNESYHVPERDAYRALGQTLYAQDLHERIQALFSRSDEQNARLKALLSVH